MERIPLLVLLIGLMSQSPLWVSGAEWADTRTAGPFLFRSQFPLRDVDGLVQEIVDLQGDLERDLGLECRPQQVQIHLFNSRGSYTSYLSRRVPEGVQRQALFVKGTDADRVYAYRHLGLETDLRHESTHALLHSALPYVPLWLDEGLAEYYEVTDGARRGANPHLREVRMAAKGWWQPNLVHLESRKKQTEMTDKDYRDSWAIVHYLLQSRAELRAEFVEHLIDIQKGRVPPPLSERLNKQQPGWDRGIVPHFRQGKF